MSDQPEPIDPRTLPLEPVECSLGTWTHSDVDDHGNVYLITRPDGQVWGIRAKADLSAENLEDDIANPGTLPPTPRRQRTRIILDRLTPTELAALHAAKQSSAVVDAFVLKASIEGIISEADADFAAGRAALDAAGIIAAARWEELFA